METAVPGRQILDATFALSQHVEKTLDMHGQGCIAAADILAYFDHLDPLRIVHWLLKTSFPKSLAATLLRLHCLPMVEMSIGTGAVVVPLKCRTNGFFTGTRTAGTASRIPLLDVAHSRMEVWKQLSAQYNSMSFSLTSFVDNVYSTGRTPADAIGILEDLELQLGNKWRLHFGHDSKEILPTTGCDVHDLSAHVLSTWPPKSTMKCLGHIISANGSIENDFKHAKASMWGAFWANFRPGLRKAPSRAKLRFIQTCIKPVAAFKWSRWPWQKTYATRLDQTQSHMLALLFPCAPLPGESDNDYFRRRSLRTGRLATKMGRWSTQWAQSVRNWHAHCARAHDAKNWCSHIYSFHGPAWLQQQRQNNSRQGETNRTCTRSTQGKVTRRWFEGHNDAKMIPPHFPDRSV